MTEELPGFLREWIPRQRWFANKGGGAPMLTRVGSWIPESGDESVDILVHLVLDTSGTGPVLFQIPITKRRSPLAGAEHALIAKDDRGYYYDGAHDPVFAAALLDLVRNGAESLRGDYPVCGTALPHPDTAEATTARVAASRVLSGEQSNTSIIFDMVDEKNKPVQPLICKLFRVLHPGENPDVAVQCALASVGSSYIPEPLGYVTGQWEEREEREEPTHPVSASTRSVTGHLAFVQEFLPDAPDAWRVALRVAAAGEDFGSRAHSLGEATASVHADLAKAFPTEIADDHEIAAIVDGMRERYRVAANEVAALREYGPAIEAAFARAQEEAWPALQRIHGDYHLGQVLDVPGRGWVLIDFEGEPLRPMAERGKPDVPLRDIAGMLRSFSYVAGNLASSSPEGIGTDTETAWVSASRQSFLDGYSERSGVDLRNHGVLLDAFELDKAIYEARYESRNRPDWLPIPLAGVRRLAHAQPA